ncbi:hypothetical protein [Treponema phagedenis]|uniref:Uncharacterized protein n=1 Tax=Treponema phagedenis TaxID=162 RepID=A0A0B7GU22_TREPH|nr:hypothetical protein [Treponema phagedenis]NVP23546.1 hypothetical protein [Treponema phagedenis]QLC58385.1 hypothetical protein HW453_05810 [Treponema phagedenis]CEM60470.1 conserved hypothetical protein [Treponema phagedenis]
MHEQPDFEIISKELARQCSGVEFGEVGLRLVIHQGRITIIEYLKTQKERQRAGAAI